MRSYAAVRLVLHATLRVDVGEGIDVMTDAIFGDCSWKVGIEEVGLVEKLGEMVWRK
jgi:hypothetical protein